MEQIYVDDIIFGSTNSKFLEEFVNIMEKEFQINLVRELNDFLGLQVKQTKEGTAEEGNYIYRTKYTKELIKWFEMENSKEMATLMVINVKLYSDPNENLVDVKYYGSDIGGLLYLIARRPDILFVVGVYVRFQSCVKESHLLVVKRIFKYLKGEINVEL